jgi:predicted outer membrane repeat protein
MRKVYFLIMCLLVLVCPNFGFGKTIHVDQNRAGCPDNPNPPPDGTTHDTAFCKIEDAINILTDDDTIKIYAGIDADKSKYIITKTIKINFNNVTLEGVTVNSNQPAIDGNQMQVISCTGYNLTLENLIIENGKATNGGGIYFISNDPQTLLVLTITKCKITGNEAMGHGGGIYCKNSTLKIDDTHVKNNKSGIPDGTDICLDGLNKIILINATWNNGVVGITK